MKAYSKNGKKRAIQTSERKSTESTRYFCAAVQMDDKFCDQVLEDTLEENYKVIAICHDVDLPCVIRSCLSTKERRRERDIPLVVLTIIAFIAFFSFIPLSFILYIIAWGIVFFDQKRIRYNILGQHLQRNNFDPEFFDLSVNQKTAKKLEEIEETQKANVIIYDGFSPFVGSGLNMGGWSLSIDVTKGKNDVGCIVDPLSFEISELYDYISDSINELELDNLQISDSLHINGQDLRGYKEILPSPLMRPITKLENDFVSRFVENPTHSIRHYRCIRVTDWKGELILSIFLRFARIGKNLFIEADYYLLAPVSAHYRRVDSFKSEPSFEDMLKLAIETSSSTFKYCLASIFFGINSIKSAFPILSDSRRKRRKKRN
jgi:hypothetical protein